MTPMKRAWIASAVMAGLATTGAGAAAVERPSPPDIAILIADDLGWNDVGYHGSPIPTPNLDQLAAEGVQLDRHYVFPSCVATRAALLSGRDPQRLGLPEGPGGRGAALSPSVATLAVELAARGYETAFAGKWHVGSAELGAGPQRYGFERSYGFVGGAIDPLTHLSLGGAPVWHRDGAPLRERGHATDLIASEAVRVLEAPRERPLFLVVAFSAPHIPLREDDARVRALGALGARATYAASVSHMDEAIGRIVRAVAASARRADTLLLFFSDNGASRPPRDPGRWGVDAAQRLGDNSPLRGFKAEVYEGAIRVPALVSWQGVLEPAVRREVVSALDWYPTLLALAGSGDGPDDLEGRDVWPLLSGRALLPAPTLRWRAGRQRAVRQGDWKLVVGPEGGAALFDLGSDPGEGRDLAAAHPERVRALLALLED